LILFVAMLAIAQAGWGIYFLTSSPHKPRPRPQYLAIRGFYSPTFKYRFPELSEDGQSAVWRVVKVPEETGRKFLNLLRGSKSTALVEEEYYRDHPGQQRRYKHFYPNSIGVLHVYENGSDQPALNIDFQASMEFIVTRPSGESDLFVIPPEKRVELDDVTAAIQWGPIPKDES
jgi:hypothetical protein